MHHVLICVLIYRPSPPVKCDLHVGGDHVLFTAFSLWPWFFLISKDHQGFIYLNFLLLPSINFAFIVISTSLNSPRIYFTYLRSSNLFIVPSFLISYVDVLVRPKVKLLGQGDPKTSLWFLFHGTALGGWAVCSTQSFKNTSERGNCHSWGWGRHAITWRTVLSAACFCEESFIEM